MFPSLPEYEQLVYTLPNRYPSIQQSTASTYPHHKHVPPDIKRHRVQAPNISFDNPNFAALIDEIESNLLSI